MSLRRRIRRAYVRWLYEIHRPPADEDELWLWAIK